MDSAERSREAWIREAWAKRRRVYLTLAARCSVPSISGRVTYVATTGAFCRVAATGGGEWHVPLDVVQEYR